MVNYKAKRKKKRLTAEDIEELKNRLQIGDTVWIEAEEKGDFGEDVRGTHRLIKAKVVKKYRNLVEINGGGTRKKTATYKEILMGKMKKRKEHEEAVG